MAAATPTYTTINSHLVRHKASHDPTLKGKCALCKKPGTMVCKGCKDSPSPCDPVINTHYCSSTCQKQDWKIHKTLCKSFQARKVLYRAGSILQRIFYIYRKEVFDKLIDRVERKDGKIYLYGGQYRKVDHPMGFLHSFPSHLFQSEEEQQAVLVHFLLAKQGTPIQGEPNLSHLPQLLHIHAFASKTLDAGAVRWEKDYGLTVGEMLRMAPDAFELHRKELIDTITTELVCTLEYARGKDAE